MLLLGVSLTPLQGHTTMNVKAALGTQTPYTLSSVRKLTFPSTGNMTVSKTSGTSDNYVLSDLRYLNFSDVNTYLVDKIEATTQLHVYPNPVLNMLHMQLASTENQTAKVEILSIEGKVLYHSRLAGVNSHGIDLSHLKQGMYLCRVNDGIGIQTTKFLKK